MKLNLQIDKLHMLAPFRISGYVFEHAPVLRVELEDGGLRGRGEASGVYYLDDKPEQMLDAIIEGMVAQEIPTEKCGQIDRVIGLLAPLPAQNTADLIAVVLGIAGKSGKAQTDKFSICKS